MHRCRQLLDEKEHCSALSHAVLFGIGAVIDQSNSASHTHTPVYMDKDKYP